MRGLGVAALCAAGAMAFAGAANATVMIAGWSGDFNDNPMYSDWGITIVYDTSLATESFPPLALGHQLSWDASSGTPSPVLSLTGSVTGRTSPKGCCYTGPFPVPDQTFSITDFSSFILEQGGYDGYQLRVVGGLQSIDIGDAPGPSTNPTAIVPFDIDYTVHPNDYGHWTLDGVTASTPFTHDVVVRVAPIPEPGAWALMLTGFFGLGAALRRQRAPLVRA